MPIGIFILPGLPRKLGWETRGIRSGNGTRVGGPRNGTRIGRSGNGTRVWT